MFRLKILKFVVISMCRRFLIHDEWVGLGCGIKANCPYVGPGPADGRGVISVGVFLRDPSPYLRKFRRKLRTARPTSVTGNGT